VIILSPITSHQQLPRHHSSLLQSNVLSARAGTMTRPPLPMQKKLLILMPLISICSFISANFNEELLQLQAEEGLPTCLDQHAPLRTWKFPVASSAGGSGMVWAEWAVAAAAQPRNIARGNQSLRRGQLGGAQPASLVIADPVSDSSISATEAQLAQGQAALQVPAMLFVLFCFVLFCFVLFCFGLFCFGLFLESVHSLSLVVTDLQVTALLPVDAAAAIAAADTGSSGVTLQLHVNGTLMDQRHVEVGSSSSPSLHISVFFNWKVSQFGAHVLAISSPSSSLLLPAIARVWIVPVNSLETSSAPAFLFAPHRLRPGDAATILAEFAFSAQHCALVMGLFVDGHMIASGAGPQLSAQFTAGDDDGTGFHRVMLLIIQNGSDGPFAFPPLTQTISVHRRLQALGDDGGSGAGGDDVGARYLTFQSTFGQFNNKRVSLMSAGALSAAALATSSSHLVLQWLLRFS
jgi:hypothetical protein